MGQRINLGIVAALVVVGLALLPVWRATDPAIGAPTGVLTDAPGGVTAALRATARPGDRLFNPQPWGSWFEFVTPDVPVAVDSRFELFPSRTWSEYETVASGGNGWQAVLDRWGVTLAAVAPDDAIAARLMTAGWRETYRATDGALLTAPSR